MKDELFLYEDDDLGEDLDTGTSPIDDDADEDEDDEEEDELKPETEEEF